MKQVFKYILSSLVLLIPVLAHAATDDKPGIYTKYNYKTEGGVATRKSVSAADNNNIYTLTLETFAMGVKAIVKTYTPVDIVLVLDTSYSMDHDCQYTFFDEDQNTYRTTNRLVALQYAVNKFVHQIAYNDGYDDNGNRRVDSNNQPTVLGNRIQIVTFDSNYHDQFNAFQPAFANETTIQNRVNGFSTEMGTRTDLGMERGDYWIQRSVNQMPNSNRVVVMFTDGCPAAGTSGEYGNVPGSGSYKFRSDYAATAVNNARSIKDRGATVYSIGLIDWEALRTQGHASYPGYVADMMDYISSNYPNGSATYVINNNRPTGTNTLTCSGDRVDIQYNFYVDANETDLGQIFKYIADENGGSTSSVPGESQLVDEVSSSFELPEDYSVEQLVIYSRKVLDSGEDWSTTKTPLQKFTLPSTYDLTKLPKDNLSATDLAKIEDEGWVGVYLYNGKLVIIGFNYSKDDVTDEETGEITYGNWVGWRPVGEDEKICKGQELVVELKIVAIDGVTGGDNTNTNKASSGLYVPTYDEDENFLGYKPATYYPYPDTDLPINIVIEKIGLKHGESATIQIYRAPQKAGEYNINTGKPAPDLTDGWENFSKVILTNKGDDGATVTKTLLSLDPKYVYRLKEDDWSWSYTLSTKDVNTSEQVGNPFTFSNSDKDVTVKHAEAVSINHFGANFKTESYKSSKTGYFTNTNTTDTE